MKKNFCAVCAFLSIAVLSFSNEIDIRKIDFTGVNIANHSDKFDDSERNLKYNLAYSAILPAGGIYCLTDSITGKEAIIQIGYSIVNQSPYIVYISDELFKFFSATYEKKIDKLNLKVKFIGWNKDENETSYLDIQNLVVEPSKSVEEMKKNGEDKVYIQRGSYTYHQNAFPGITQMLPYLEVRPNFYLVKKDLGEDRHIYRVLAGPYNLTDARRIVESLNDKKEKSIFIQTLNNLFGEESKKNEEK